MSDLLYKLYHKIENIIFVFVSFIPFQIDFNFFNFFYNFVWEDMIIVLFLYNFIKYVILCSINELIWPTHVFNRKHSNSSNFIRFRTYSEYILKLKGYNRFFYLFNLVCIKYIFINKK